MSFKVINTEIGSQLVIVFEADGVKTKIQSEVVPELKVYYAGELLFRTYPDGIVLNPEPGVYVHKWTPENAGQYKLVWSFVVGGVTYPNEEYIFVLENVSSQENEDDGPDIALSKVCKVHWDFLTPGGKFKKGVFVRFEPTYDADSVVADGYSIGPETAESDANGHLEMYLIRGLKGMLSITGSGVVREVEIPDQNSISLADLMSTGEDSFEVQTPKYYEAPRRS